jgi:hypothetical protein
MSRRVRAKIAAPPDDLLVLLEAPVEEVDLHRETVPLGLAVEVREVLVVRHRFVVHVEAKVLAERGRERGLARPDDPCDADERSGERAVLPCRRAARLLALGL